ncbi:MAG TPA: hypothetical protein VGL93_21500 [Streptosporangiaceae bacterium]|jgi:hypothetical protein
MLGPNGHWVRTRSEESAKSFIAEQRSAKDFGERFGGGRLPWILLAIVLVAVAGLVLAGFVSG